MKNTPPKRRQLGQGSDTSLALIKNYISPKRTLWNGIKTTSLALIKNYISPKQNAHFCHSLKV